MLADTLPRQRTLPTLVWTGAGALALIVAQLLAVFLYVLGMRLAHPGLSTSSVLSDNVTIVRVTVISIGPTILFLWGLTRFRTRAVAGYLALCWPSLRQFAISVVAFVLFMAGLAVFAHLMEPGSDVKFMLDIVSAARAANAIPLMIAAVVIAAPVGEELVFRGFLYRTLELKFGGTTAIVVTALGWAVLHIQYSLVGMVAIFAGGLFFGAIRRYSGSLYVTILMHALWNGFALAGALLMLSKP